MADNTVKFITTTETAYDALETKDPNAIYTLEDVGRIRKGSVKLSDILIEVDSLPLAGINGKIYILPSLEGYIFKDGAWKLFIGVASTISTTYSIPFVIGSTLVNGPQPLLVKVPENGKITDIEALISNVGTSDISINLEKISETDFESSGVSSFANIFADDNNVKIPVGKLSNKSASAYVLADNTISKGDILRINVIDNGGGSVKGLSFQISISII